MYDSIKNRLKDKYCSLIELKIWLLPQPPFK